jgi:hypothetical protein
VEMKEKRTKCHEGTNKAMGLVMCDHQYAHIDGNPKGPKVEA